MNRAHLHVLDEIVEQGIALGLLLLARADRDVQTHDNHSHQSALEFVPQKLRRIAGHGLWNGESRQINVKIQYKILTLINDTWA